MLMGEAGGNYRLQGIVGFGVSQAPFEGISIENFLKTLCWPDNAHLQTTYIEHTWLRVTRDFLAWRWGPFTAIPALLFHPHLPPLPLHLYIS